MGTSTGIGGGIAGDDGEGVGHVDVYTTAGATGTASTTHADRS